MGILDWWKNRKRMQEIERNIEARRGKAQIRRHIKKQKQMTEKLWELGRRALELGDKGRFRQIGKHYLWTQSDIKRWERYLVAFETIEARRDQAHSMAEFMSSVQAMSKSMLANANPEAMAETQRDLEMGIARAQDLEQTMDFLMDMTEDTIFGMAETSDAEMEESLRELQRAMAEESVAESEGSSGEELDALIEEGLRQLEEEMRKDRKK